MAFEISPGLHSYPLQGFRIVERDLSHYSGELISNRGDQGGPTWGIKRGIGLLTACICQVILPALDSIFQAFCFSSCSRDLGLHLFSSQVGRHGANWGPSRTRLMVVHR